MNFNRGKLYTEIVYLYEIYNFIVPIVSLNLFWCSKD
jgi:hypothetical protein